MRTLCVLALVLAAGCSRPPAQLPPPRNYSPPVVAPVRYVPTPAPAPPPSLPPSLVPVETPTTRRSYASKLMLVDVPLLLTFVPVLDAVDDGTAGTALAFGYLAAYLIVPPLLHDAEGNRREADRSIARRLGYPLLGLLGGFAIGAARGGECRDLCGVIGALGGTGLGAVIAAVHDWASAYVEE